MSFLIALASCATLGTAVGFRPARVPRVGPQRRLGAVKEHLFDVDLQRQDGTLACHDHLVEVVGVGEDACGPVDPQPVPPTGDQEQCAHVGPLRNRDRGAVDDMHEARRIALRGHVDAALRIGRRHESQREVCQPVLLRRRKSLADLVRDVGVRLADDGPQLVDGGDFTTHRSMMLDGHSSARRH